ncbi:MAG: exosortase/archaeosortase family protein [Polyangiaceae bacterium]
MKMEHTALRVSYFELWKAREFLRHHDGFLVLALQLASLWPVVVWGIRRTFDGSDEPLGILALATVIVVFAIRLIGKASCAGQRAAASDVPARVASAVRRDTGLLGPALSLVYAIGLFVLPRPIASLVGLLALALTSSRLIYGRTLNVGLLGLLWLSVPILGSLDFYLGYPLRIATTELAAALLRLSGNDVTRRGVSLMLAGREVSVDPACAGLRMLWMTAYFVSLLGCLRPLRGFRMLPFAGLAFVLLVVANAWRAAALYYVESGLVRLPPWGHEAVGAVVLLSLFVALAGLYGRFRRAAPTQKSRQIERRGSFVPVLFAATALTGSFVPTPHRQNTLTVAEPRWPSVYRGERLEREPMPPELAGFYREFPGSVAFFRSERHRYVFRHVTQPTRKLHPAEHCYRGAGYQVEPVQICGASVGERFGCFVARRGHERVLVKERIEDRNGRVFTDVSSWYWAAWLGQSQAPWTTVTLVERRDP